MENASKALIIAGAILISILLIAISMYVYTSAQGTVTQAGAQMTAQEKDMYNAKINSYVGNSKAIEAKNIGNNVAFTGTGAPTWSSNGTKIGDEGHAKNDSSYVNGNSKYMSTLKSAINTGKRYDISVDTSSTGLIIKVTITEK